MACGSPSRRRSPESTASAMRRLPSATARSVVAYPRRHRPGRRDRRRAVSAPACGAGGSAASAASTYGTRPGRIWLLASGHVGRLATAPSRSAPARAPGAMPLASPRGRRASTCGPPDAPIRTIGSTLLADRVRHPIVHAVCARYYRQVTKEAGQHRMCGVRNLSLPRLLPRFSHDPRSISCNSGTKFPDMSASAYITAPECRADYRRLHRQPSPTQEAKCYASPLSSSAPSLWPRSLRRLRLE